MGRGGTSGLPVDEGRGGECRLGHTGGEIHLKACRGISCRNEQLAPPPAGSNSKFPPFPDVALPGLIRLIAAFGLGLVRMSTDVISCLLRLYRVCLK